MTEGNSRKRIACLLLLIASAYMMVGCGRRVSEAARHKVIVLGIDGMDPQLLHRYEQDGRMPNFQRLEQEGSFRELRTSIPPQSPVAWSNVITGMNPGGHGVYDFIERDPNTMLPEFSMARVEAPAHTLSLGSWVIPLSAGKALLLRRGRAFWQILDEHGIPATVIHIPANFPPAESRSRTLAGMGAPDMQGTYGIFSFYTDDPIDGEGERSGGVIYPVQVQDHQVSAKLYGPPNTFRKGSPQVPIDFTVWIDPSQPVAKIAIQDREILLREGEWSDWVQIKFTLIPGLASATGICRMYMKQVSPYFKLYISPVNIDPSQPALPLSTPAGYSKELWKQVGFYYTQGIAEDTKALSDRVLTDGEYLEQARLVLAEQLRFLDVELAKLHGGMLFAYFSSLDQNAHMFWRAFDKNSPAYDPDVSAKYADTLEWFYQQMDQMLGKALAKADGDTTVIVMSDHGFAPYDRSFNLNTWLLGNGYIALKPGQRSKPGDLFTDVDWTHTRAYGLGLNGLFLNLRGRERWGMVAPGAEAEALQNEIRDKLLAVRDPLNGLAPVTRVDKAQDVYSGESVRDAPDLVVGYNRGYRAGWATDLGEFTTEILEPNTEPWSGDHCIDYTLVPGVLLSNKNIVMQSPALTDIAPTVLAEYGIAKPANMVGQSVFKSEESARR